MLKTNPALVGFAAVMAPLTLGNNLKRFLGWLDSFTRGGAAVIAKGNKLKLAEDWGKHRAGYTEQLIEDGDSPTEYLNLFCAGVKATILPYPAFDKAWFTSLDADLLEKQAAKLLKP